MGEDGLWNMSYKDRIPDISTYKLSHQRLPNLLKWEAYTNLRRLLQGSKETSNECKSLVAIINRHIVGVQ